MNETTARKCFVKQVLALAIGKHAYAWATVREHDRTAFVK